MNLLKLLESTDIDKYIIETKGSLENVDIKNIRNVLKFIAIISFTIAGLNILGIILEKHFLGIQSLTVLNENISVIVQIFVKEIYRVLYTSTASGTVLGLLFSILCSK